MTNGWVVDMTFDPGMTIDDEQLDALSDRFDEKDWTVSVDPGGLRVIAHVEDDRALEEAPHTAKVAGKVLVDVGVHAQLAKVSVIKEERWEQEAQAPALPELVAALDVAERLGITRQRVHQLAHDHPEFPEPAVRTRAGSSLWTHDAIERFATTWDRRPGRRRAASTQVVDLASRARPRPVDAAADEHAVDWRQEM